MDGSAACMAEGADALREKGNPVCRLSVRRRVEGGWVRGGRDVERREGAEGEGVEEAESVEEEAEVVLLVPVEEEEEDEEGEEGEAGE